MKAQFAHAHKEWKRDRTKVSCPLPVSVFNWRVSDSSYGFASLADRNQAKKELFKLFPPAQYTKWTKTADGKNDRPLRPCLSFVTYRDTHAVFAAQIIVWLPNQAGGFHLTSGRFLVSGRERKIAASLLVR